MQRTYLIISLQAVRDALVDRGVEVSGVFQEATLGGRFHDAAIDRRVPGLSPDRTSYGIDDDVRDITGFLSDGPPWLTRAECFAGRTKRPSAVLKLGDPVVDPDLGARAACWRGWRLPAS